MYDKNSRTLENILVNMSAEVNSNKQENAYVSIKVEPLDASPTASSEPKKTSNHSANSNDGFNYMVPIEYSKTLCLKTEILDNPSEFHQTEAENGEVSISVLSSTEDVVKYEPKDSHSLSERSFTHNPTPPLKCETNPRCEQEKKMDKLAWSSTNQQSRYEGVSTPPLNDHSELIVTITHRNGKVQYSCKICNSKYKCWRNVKKHICTHTGDKAFICDICYEKFSRGYELTSHKVRTHTEERPYLCGMCNSAFKRANDLITHKRMHTGERPFHCDTCDGKFRTSTHLVKHKRIHTGERPYACEICSKKFKEAQALKRHTRVHTGEKPYRCDLCEARFTNYSSLKVHMQYHDKEKAFGCDVCGAKFSTSSYLKIHARLHTGEKPFGCDTCGKKFAKAQVLKVHIRKHTGEKPFCCKICDKKFTFSTSLRVHMRTHNGELKFNCDKCDSKFRLVSHLREHKRLH